VRAVLLLLVLVAAAPAWGQEVYIAGGTFTPLYSVGSRNKVAVKPFYLARDAVTNAEFLSFVRAHPQWRRSQVPRIFADENYLKDWTGDLQFPAGLENRPVTGVSWFAARAWCRARGRRLPSEAEWEFVARASDRKLDASRDPAFLRTILDWYARPTPARLPAVSSGRPNLHGVRGMHGLIWEWVDDFNSVLVTGESRQDGALDRNLFCAAGSAGSKDPTNYAAYMRYAFRASLEARFTVRNLGFRCARDAGSKR